MPGSQVVMNHRGENNLTLIGNAKLTHVKQALARTVITQVVLFFALVGTPKCQPEASFAYCKVGQHPTKVMQGPPGNAGTLANAIYFFG